MVMDSASLSPTTVQKTDTTTDTAQVVVTRTKYVSVFLLLHSANSRYPVSAVC